jgi:hypothetical protein
MSLPKSAGHASRRIDAPLAYRLPQGTGEGDAALVAEAVAAVWHDVETALQPIIGQRGLAALYARSLHLAAARHAWLLPDRHAIAPDIDLENLKTVLAQQGASSAVDAGNNFLQTFHGLLTTLIGASLTERLLRSAWGPPISSAAAQDNLP